jgi:hypothetical protein
LPGNLWVLLLEAAAQLDIRIRVEKLEQTPGGLCRIKGQNVIFIDKTMDMEAKTRCLAQSLQQLNLELIYIKPRLRDYLRQLESQSEQT